MRRSDREMCYEDTVAALTSGKWGVLSMWDGEEPYGVPVNYVYSHGDGAIFLHCAKKGRKLDIIKLNSSVSFAVVSRERIVPERFTTLYESVIVSGKASIVENEDEKVKRLIQLCEALTPENTAGRGPYIKKYLSETAIIRIDIENISGKSNID